MTDSVDNSPGTVSEWNDSQWKNFKWWLENLLRSEVVEVIFAKTDGSERVMRCTMKPLVISAGVKLLEEKRARESSDNPAAPKKPRTKPKEPPENITVWDIDVEDWRSFKVRSLTNILTLIIKYDYREPNIGDFEVVF